MTETQKLNAVKILLDTEKAQQAKDVFYDIQPNETVDYYLLKGKIEQKFQNWGEAINAFNRVLDLDPGNSEAENNLHLIQNILNFWNPDLLNP
jgi:tetratricopeptide (TPR) repeat protein